MIFNHTLAVVGVSDLTRLIRGWGFNTVITRSDWSQFPHDGTVARADNREYFEKLATQVTTLEGALP